MRREPNTNGVANKSFFVRTTNHHRGSKGNRKKTTTVTLTQKQVLTLQVVLGSILFFSVAITIVLLVLLFKVEGYLNGDMTIDNVSLIPSVSNFLQASTNSESLITVLTRGAALSRALATIDWTKPVPQECETYETCDWDDNVVRCYDYRNQTACDSAPTADMGVFRPEAGCYWYYDYDDYGYCEGSMEYCKVDALKTEQHCLTDDATDSKTDNNRRVAFNELANRMSEAIDNVKDDRTSSSPKSSFDIVGYFAKELDQDWGEIGERFADNLENLAKNDWEKIFSTFNGDVEASENAATTKTVLRFYKDWVVKITSPLKGV